MLSWSFSSFALGDTTSCHFRTMFSWSASSFVLGKA
uniref:Uncharacterized protein n=1 Tax=Rhizophora mucronata TaxID=61149 RepID=A0A2P2KTL4_RHIMU